MKIIKLIVFSLPFLVLVVFPPVVKAETLLAQATTSATITASPSARTLERMENLRNRANLEIDRRITALNKLLTKITTIKKLSTEQKNSLSQSVQSEITALTTLKAKIAADTDFETLKTDAKAIVSSHRIFAFFMPKIEILAASGVLAETADRAASLSARLQIKLDEAKANGENVTLLQESLNSLSARILNAQKMAKDAQDLVLSLTPDGYPANKTSLQNARSMIQEGRRDLNITTFMRILQQLKQMQIKSGMQPATNSANSSPSAFPTQ